MAININDTVKINYSHPIANYMAGNQTFVVSEIKISRGRLCAFGKNGMSAPMDMLVKVRKKKS